MSGDRDFLKRFFQRVNDRPLEPDDEEYVPLYADESLAGDDPVALMQRAIEWTVGDSSVQLLSGFRGSGKSTELRRLRKCLRAQGYAVVLLDVEDYLDTSSAIDVSDFLLAVAGGLSDMAFEEGLVDRRADTETYWQRFVHFLTRTNVSVEELTGGVKAGPGEASLRLNLRSDPSFRRRLQEKMAGLLGEFVRDLDDYMGDLAGAVKRARPESVGLVVLVDSVEHIRGTSVNATDVQSSVERLFTAHSEKLHLSNVHVVYTVPPYLKVLSPMVSALYEPGGVQVLPAIKVVDRDGTPFKPGLDALERVVRGRGDWEKLLGSREVLDRLSLKSGGHLRDLLRALAEVVRRADELPVPAPLVDRVLSQLQAEALPVSDADARWLARVAETHTAALPDAGRLPDFARFLDTHLVLCYRNGEEWYDVHPLVHDEVLEQARQLERR